MAIVRREPLVEMNCETCASPYMYDVYHQAGQSAYCPHSWYPTHEAPPTQEENKRHGHPLFYKLVDEITALHDRKNKDYAGGMKEGPLGNFIRVSEIKKLYPGMDWSDPFGVAMSYMLKQLDAAFTLRSTGKESVTGEPVKARLTDVVVYSLIGIILEEEEKKAGENGKNK